MRSYEKNRVPHIVFGNGSSASAGERMKAMGCTKVLIVTDKGVVKAGLVAPIAEALEKAGLEYVIWDKSMPNAPDTTCLECADFLNGEQCDGVLAIGGGSSIDTAKASTLISNLPEKPKDLHEYGGLGMKMKPSYTRKVKFVCIPTTAGTGAEATVSAVIHDTKRNIKYSFMNENTVPDLNLIDPELTVKMPAFPTACVGIDAMSHALESIVGLGQNEYTDRLNMQCIELVWRWLPIAIKEPENMAAREALAWAANNAESNGGAANGHAVSHALGARYNIIHGEACAMVMPTLVRHHAKQAEDNLRIMAKFIGIPYDEDKETLARRVADAIVRFNRSCGLRSFKEAMKANGFHDSKAEYVENCIEPILDDYKSRVWNPPIHGAEDRDRLVAVLESIYDEE